MAGQAQQIPRELQKLDDDYNALIDHVEQGHASVDQAMSILSGMSAIDGAGAVWTINEDGELLRAEYQGAPAQPASADQWTEEGTPRSTMPKIPFLDAETPAAPPDDLYHRGFGNGADVSVAVSGPFEDAEKSTTLWERKAARGRRTPPRTSDQPDAGRIDVKAVLWDKLRRNVAVVAVVVVGVVVFIALSLGGGPGVGDGLSPVPPALPAPMPVGSSPAPTIGAGTDALNAAAAQPSEDQSRKVISALSTGKPATVAATLAVTLERLQLTRTVALWAGAKSLGLTVTPSPAAPTDGGAVQQWTVYDGSTPLTKVTVNWVAKDGQWLLAAAPTF